MDVFILALLLVRGGRRIGLRIAVLARGKVEGQYSHLKANTTDLGPVPEPVWKHQFHCFFINQLFVLNFLSVESK